VKETYREALKLIGGLYDVAVPFALIAAVFALHVTWEALERRTEDHREATEKALMLESEVFELRDAQAFEPCTKTWEQVHAEHSVWPSGPLMHDPWCMPQCFIILDPHAVGEVADTLAVCAVDVRCIP